MSGPSEKAIRAAVSWQEDDHGLGYDAISGTLAAAHDPALGLDRSVRLRDVIEPLRELATWADRYDGEIAGRLNDKLDEFEASA